MGGVDRSTFVRILAARHDLAKVAADYALYRDWTSFVRIENPRRRSIPEGSQRHIVRNHPRIILPNVTY